MRNISEDILSACLYDSENLAMCAERGVTPEWFESGGVIYSFLASLYERQKWDKRNSINVMDASGVFTKYKDSMELAENVPAWAFKVEEMGDAIEVLAVEHAKRKLNVAITEARNRLTDGDDPFDVGGFLAQKAEGVDLIADSTKERTTKQLADVALEIDRRVATGTRTGLPFPWIGFQSRTFGIPTKSVTPLFGRDGKGKSRLSIFLAHHWLTLGIPILYLPFEDTAERFISNLAATHGQYDMFTIKRNIVPDSFMPNHESCIKTVADMPIYVEDMPCTVEHIASLIARYKRKFSIEGVVIDGMKDIILSGGENQTTKENHVSAALVRASKRYDVSVLAVSHLTDIEDDKWISKRNIRGSKTQSQSARMALAYQDAGIPGDIRAKYGIYDDEIVFQAQKASYGNPDIVVLKPDLERGRFVEVRQQDES